MENTPRNKLKEATVSTRPQGGTFNVPWQSLPVDVTSQFGSYSRPHQVHGRYKCTPADKIIRALVYSQLKDISFPGLQKQIHENLAVFRAEPDVPGCNRPQWLFIFVPINNEVRE